MSWRARLTTVALAALACSQVLLAQSSAIKLATVVPDGSVWDKSLKQMGTEWKAATADRVSLTSDRPGDVFVVDWCHNSFSLCRGVGRWTS